MTTTEKLINKVIQSEVCTLGDVVVGQDFLDKYDTIFEKITDKVISKALKELPASKGFSYRLTRVGRIGVEHRIYRPDGAWTEADSQRTGKERTWFKLDKQGDVVRVKL